MLAPAGGGSPLRGVEQVGFGWERISPQFVSCCVTTYTTPGGWSLPSLRSRRPKPSSWRSRRGQITETAGQAWPRLCGARTCGETEGPPPAKPALSREWLDPGTWVWHPSRELQLLMCTALYSLRSSLRNRGRIHSVPSRVWSRPGLSHSPRQLLIYRGAEGGPDEAPALQGTRGGPRTRLPTAPLQRRGVRNPPAAWRLSRTPKGPPTSRGATASAQLHTVAHVDSSELASASPRGKTLESSQRSPGGFNSPPAPATAAGAWTPPPGSHPTHLESFTSRNTLCEGLAWPWSGPAVITDVPY